MSLLLLEALLALFLLLFIVWWTMFYGRSENSGSSLQRLKPGEGKVLAVYGVLLLLAILGPTVAQVPTYHDFADQRTLLGIPYTLDVLSNLVFLALGVLGLWRISQVQVQAQHVAQHAWGTLFFIGLMLTATGSAWYHWQPDDGTLVVDRLGMATTFSSLMAVITIDRISTRLGTLVGIVTLLLSSLAVLLWMHNGNLLPWVVVQAGSLVGIAAFALWSKPRAEAWGITLWPIIAWYAVAKACELYDHQIFHATQGWVSGHSLKHIAAALAALPVIRALPKQSN